jgi:sugar lactone lactonase YvrE
MFGSSVFLNVSSPINPARSLLRFGPFGLRINIDSIGLDRQGKYLYYGALTGDKLYSIQTSKILEAVHKQGADSLGNEVKIVCSEKPVTDGISVDGAGNIWMTAVEHSSIVIALPFVTPPSETFHVMKVIQSPQFLRWPDGLSFGPDGLYITASNLQHPLGGKKNYTSEAPFHILRIPTKQLKRKEIYRGKKFTSTPAGH